MVDADIDADAGGAGGRAEQGQGDGIFGGDDADLLAARLEGGVAGDGLKDRLALLLHPGDHLEQFAVLLLRDVAADSADQIHA